MITLKDV